jgi:hypothetical protein
MQEKLLSEQFAHLCTELLDQKFLTAMEKVISQTRQFGEGGGGGG